ncbi:epsin-3-like [Nymphaea colorata]|nr:epsin-3-like [Nymphaea colorata]
MGTPFLVEIKKQASFFFKEKLRSARLAFTDVTPAELLTEEVTNGNPSAPDTKVMGLISKAAFEVGDYWRIVEILHKRLEKFDRKNWRQSYQALVLLEYLLTHGPESVSGEFQCDKEVIKECGDFQYVDERGFNWGLPVKNKCERILKFLDDGGLLKEERQRARKLTCGIKGFGSFSQMSLRSEAQRFGESIYNSFERWNSQCNDYAEQDDSYSPTAKSSARIGKNSSCPSSEFYMDPETSLSAIEKNEFSSMPLNEQTKGSDLREENTENENFIKKEKDETVSAKNLTAKGHDDQWDLRLESDPLFGVDEKQQVGYADSSLETCNSHPFMRIESHAKSGLLSSGLR